MLGFLQPATALPQCTPRRLRCGSSKRPLSHRATVRRRASLRGVMPSKREGESFHTDDVLPGEDPISPYASARSSDLDEAESENSVAYVTAAQNTSPSPRTSPSFNDKLDGRKGKVRRDPHAAALAYNSNNGSGSNGGYGSGGGSAGGSGSGSGANAGDPPQNLWRQQNTALVDMAKAHGVDAAIDLLWDYVDKGEAYSQNFNQAVSLLASDHRVDEGLELAIETGRRGFANIITFRPLMKVCCATGDGRTAKRIWRHMVDYGIDGDMFLYAELMGALVRSQDLKAAERVLDSLHESGKRPHIVLYNTLLKGVAKLADVELAFETLDRLVAFNVSPDETTFNTILNTCVRAKDLDALHHAMDLMRQHEIEPGVPTFNTLLKLYARAGKFDDALDIFHEMQQTVEPSIVTYNTLIDGCAHRGDMELAAEFFDEMMEKGMTPDICTMTSLLKGFGRSNNPGRAVELYEAMKEGGYHIEERTRYAVINACLRGGDRLSARKLMAEMLSSGHKIRARTWLWRLESDVGASDENAALTTLREMDVHGVLLDSLAKASLLKECRSRGNMIRLVREIKSARTSSTNVERRRDE